MNKLQQSIINSINGRLTKLQPIHIKSEYVTIQDILMEVIEKLNLELELSEMIYNEYGEENLFASAIINKYIDSKLNLIDVTIQYYIN